MKLKKKYQVWCEESSCHFYLYKECDTLEEAYLLQIEALEHKYASAFITKKPVLIIVDGEEELTLSCKYD